MKTLIMNIGRLTQDNVGPEGLPPSFHYLCQKLFAQGQLTFTHPNGNFEVQFRTAGADAFIDVSANGLKLLNSIVVARGHRGSAAWQKFHHQFVQLRETAQIHSEAAMLRRPGRGPWTAVIIHLHLLALSSDEIGRAGYFQSAVARVFAK